METDGDPEGADAVAQPVGIARGIAVVAQDPGRSEDWRSGDAVELRVAVGPAIAASGHARNGAANVDEQQRQQEHGHEPTHVHFSPSM
jgi:hypothetical protein